MGRASERKISAVVSRLTNKYGPLDKGILEMFRAIRDAYSRTGDLLQETRTQLTTLRQENRELSEDYQESKQLYQRLEKGYQELEKKYERVERRLGDFLIDKSALEKRVEELSEIIDEGSKLNESYRKRIGEFEKEKTDLTYKLHIAKAQISLDLPQNLGIKKVVIIGEGQFKLGEMDVPLSKYFADMLRARVVTIDENDWDKPKTISQSLQNAEFVVVVDAGRSGPPHSIRDVVYAQGITAENGRYIRMSERSSQAVSEILKKIIETKRGDICVQ